MTGWTTHSSRTVYENAWVRVREDAVTRPDGGDGIYGVTQLVHPSVFVVPVTDAGEVVMVHLYRYPIGRWSLEVPAGGSDGQDALVAARRELREEAGLEAGAWTTLGEMYSLNGLADAPSEVFVARDLTEVDASHTQREEGITDVRRVPWPQVWELLRSGAVTDGETMAALLMARVALGL